MPDITSTCEIWFGASPEGGAVRGYIETPATADNADTIVVDISAYGGRLKGITAYRHSTTDSIIVADDAPTTAVASGVLTITIGGSTANKKRVFEVLVK
ncbi:MAG: hypothetical protein WC451_02755 [Patescibacteria group bacterium]